MAKWRVEIQDTDDVIVEAEDMNVDGDELNFADADGNYIARFNSRFWVSVMKVA